MKSLLRMLREKGIPYTVNRIRIRFPFLFTTKIPILKADNEWRLYKKYSRKYGGILKKDILNDSCSDHNKKELKFWTLWLQGEDKAPDIVKKCISQVRKFYGDEHLVVLNSETIGDYVHVPDYITYKHDKGLITHAHYSDIIRTLLLCEHGGVWIDSTCYMSAPLPDAILNNKLFVFRMPKCFPGAIKASSWMIVADKNSVIMSKLKKILLTYWMNNNSIEDYLLYHIFFSIVVDSTEETRKEWGDMPYYNNDNPHILGRELFNSINVSRINEIKKMSFVHKLSWRTKGDIANSNFEYIINI